MIHFRNIKVGEKYDRNFLAEEWGYKSYKAISRGIITPKNQNIIVLFVTKEKQDCLTQYNDDYDEVNQILTMEGEAKHKNDSRIINSYTKDEHVYLFYRKKHHSDFVFIGRVYLIAQKINHNNPSKFIFCKDFNYKNINVSIKNEYTYLRSVDCTSIAKYSVNKNKTEILKDLTKSNQIRENRTKRHSEIVRKFAKHLVNKKYQLYEGRIDCLGVKQGFNTIIAEIKTLDGTKQDEYKQVMKAFAQLYYYETFEMGKFQGSNCEKVVVFENKISDKHILFFESNNIKVIWLNENKFCSLNL